MKQETGTAQKNEFGWSLFNPFTPENMFLPMRFALGENSELLAEHQKNLETWAKRRQDAFNDGWRALQALMSEKDPVARSKLANDWVAKATRRFFADLNESRDLCLRLAEMSGKSMLALWVRDDGQGAKAARSETPSPPAGKPQPEKRHSTDQAA
jgi:hypothetical protein